MRVKKKTYSSPLSESLDKEVDEYDIEDDVEEIEEELGIIDEDSEDTED